ncbi:ADP-ribosylglycohydrolase family protein [Winogradskyella sp.]|uniref:ADP-ribosylglycohydrolase family protein n=1 Tax=Winogradskyella sp. TaxID=1883156 RepID=UPI003BAD9E1B
MKTSNIHAALFGLAVGDALGVPVEFKSRDYLKRFPVTDMQEFGTHHQPKGTWSDDSSLAFCLAHSLLQGFDLKDIALRFTQWAFSGFWTPHGKVFDIGIQTRSSIYTLQKILNQEDYEALELLKYEADEYTNGNGSLMRILPLLFHIKDKNIKEQFEIIWKVSALTHGHIRSAISCLVYLVFAEKIIIGYSMKEAYVLTQKEIKRFFISEKIADYEVTKFSRLIYSDISKLNENEISSSGYVLDTLEAGFWCLLTSSTYKETVLKAVNLGSDTDTTGAIAGGLAGLIYGYNAIPEHWLNVLARKEDIVKLCDKLTKKL